MSEYAYVDGWFEFSSMASLEQALDTLSHGGWLGTEFNRDDIVNEDALRLQIPYGHYRNLHRHIDTIGKHADTYHVVSASSDGYLMGWVDTPDGTTELDLFRWAEENGFGDCPDSDGDFEAHVEWTEDVMTDFIDSSTEPPASPA